MSVIKLGDLCDFINGGAWSQKEFSESGHPVLKVSNCKPSGFVIDDISYISDEIAEKSKANRLHIGDVIIATVGSHPNLVDSAAGRSCIVNNQVAGHYLNQNAVCLRSKNEDLLDQRYLGYLASSSSFRHYIQSRGKGAANQMRIAISAIKEYTFDIPHIEVQRKIGAVLSVYDDLIENNQKQIKLLEEAAQRLYKEWFIDLRFPGYEHTPVVDGVPEGWRRTNVNDLVTFHRGYDLTRDNMVCGKYPVIGSTSIIGMHNEFKIKGPGIVTGRSGSLGQYQFVWEDFWPHNTTLYICDYKNHDVFFIYGMLNTLDFTVLNNGGAIPTLNRNTLSSISVIEPTFELQKQYASLACAYYEKIRICKAEIEKLMKVRDSLLPKLMNGEVEV